MIATPTRRWLAAAGLGLALLAAAVGTAGAAVEFPALDRAAVQVRAPQRTVLLASALAGSRVVAVGERGIVVLSEDAGQTWRQARAVPVSVTLTAVQFVDAKRGWAVGHAGVVLRTEDGGDSWTRQADGRSLAKIALAAAQAAGAAATAQLKAAQLLVDDGPDKPLLDLHFADSNHGWIVGAYNMAFETRDGGSTWTSLMGRLDNPKGSHLYAIAVRGDSIVIVGEQGAMFGSGDGGATFKPLTSSYKGSWFSVIAAADGSLVAAGLRGNVMFSRDQGQTWSAIAGAPPVTFVGGTTLPDGSVLLANQAGQLLRTKDGAALAPLAGPSLPPPADVMPLPDGGLLVVGLTGAIKLPPPGAPAK